MQLVITDEEARTLRDVLHDYLPDLRREVAATDLGSRELRHELVKREELCEKLLSHLERDLGPSG